jgi:hypothetical protein
MGNLWLSQDAVLYDVQTILKYAVLEQLLCLDLIMAGTEMVYSQLP